MKNIFSDNRYKDKIYNVTYLRLLSYEIYKFFVFYYLMVIINTLSNHIPFSFFYELDYNSSKLFKIFFYLLIIDILYFISFKSNQGHYSIIEKITNSFLHPNLTKILSVSFSFCFLYLITNELKSSMPRLNSDYIKEKYKIQVSYRDEYEENYYERKGLTKKTPYEYTDGLFTVCVSIILLINFLIIKQKYDLWPKLDLSRIINLKFKLWITIKNIIIIGVPAFIIIYFIFIFYYHSIVIIGLCTNYASLFVLEYNIIYLSIECLHNFICPKISYFTKEVNTKTQLIHFNVEFQKEETFYIIHHLKHLNELYKYPHDVKLNTILLNLENLNNIKNKIFIFMNSLNKKYSNFLSNIKYIYINNNMTAIETIQTIFLKIFDFFDYSGNQVIENDTCLEIMKLLIELNGNIIIFIADAKISIPQEEKYWKFSESIYFFVERLYDMDKIFQNLIQNIKISENLRKNLYKLRISIINYFDLIRNRQNRDEFIKLESVKIKEILYRN